MLPLINQRLIEWKHLTCPKAGKQIAGKQEIINFYMATVDLVMPKMGESIMEATILKWLKNPGDAVKMDETVLEIATDKVDS
ncbi:MAG TPA: lipoyl domain-containing protein, partial [Flavisolibacter sp.]|nr:lipoyl domain-containing protein [Flavisolibacter sp.]